MRYWIWQKDTQKIFQVIMKNNWQTKKLGELFSIGSSKRVLKSQWKTEGIPFYRGREITRLSNEGHVNNELFISEKLYSDYAKRYGVPKAGDIVITAIGTIGNTHIVKKDDRFYFKDASVLWLNKITETSSDFINLWLKSRLFTEQLERGNGATVDTLTIQKLQNLTVNLPPLSEQKRIVKILNEAFIKLETAKQNAEKNLNNSKELFESYLQATFSKNSKWEEMRLGDVYDVRDGTHDSPRYQKDGYALITSKNLKRDELDYRRIQYISEKDYQKINERSKVHKGDILFAMIGTIGNPVVIKIEPDFAIKNVALFKVPKEQDSYFLKFFLDSKFVIDKMVSEAKGTTQKFVGLGYLRDFKIKLPSLSEQKSIVKKLNQLSEQSRKLESVYQTKLSAIEELKKSVLSKAFSKGL